jgi:maltose alpha-D-glucosyltransferase/alpha-amylase
LFRRRGQLPEELRETIETLFVNREAAVVRLRDLLASSLDTIKIRHHGDLHLGQLLIVKDDVFIIDFEGEPERSIDARRQKAPAARDLAGLVRSLDYAGTAALDRMGPLSPEERLRLSGALDDWRAQSVEALLSTYRETLGASPVWPSDPNVAGRMLDFFTLEKAIYEIGYEMANRPAWLHVPLRGVQRLLFPSGAPA